MLYEEVIALLGDVPPGFEPLVYFGCIMLLIWFLQFVSSVLWAVLSWFGGKR